MAPTPTAPSPPAATAPPPPPPAATAPAGGAPAGGDDHETEVRRKHRRVVALPNLPKGFTVGEAVLGRHRTANERMDRNYVPNAPVPVVNVDSETERMPAPDVTVTLGADEKRYECRLTFTPRQTLKIKDYATHHGYMGDKGTHALVKLARRPFNPAYLPRRCPRVPCAGLLMNSMLHDAADGKLVPTTHLHSLAKAYESLIDKRDARIRELEKEKEGNAQQQQRPAEPPPPRGAQPANAAQQRQRQRTQAAPQGATAVEENERQDEERRKRRGRTAEPTQTDEQKEEMEKRSRRRFNWVMNGFISAAAAYAGGPAGFTLFFVYMLKLATCKTGAWKKNIFLTKDVIKLILDDPMLYAMFRKEVDARRMPTIAAFVNARLSGVSIAAMDKLRFATIWTPGHSTLAKAVKEMEKHISTTWCPNGPVASWGTTRTAEEQQRTRTADVPMDVEDEDAEDEEDAADLDREVDEAMRAPPDEREAQAVSLEEQGLALLRLEFPLATQEEINDRWAGGLGETIDNGEGGPCNVVQVMAIRDGTRLAGFLKVLVTTKELWVEELLVDEGERGKRIAWRMMDRLLGEKGLNRKLLRLQVRKDNHLAIKLYVQGWLFKKWVERSSGNWMGCTAKPEETHELYESTCARTRDAINAFLTERPPQDDDGLVMKLFAAHQIPGVVFDRVGLEDEQDEEAVPPPMEGEHTEEDFDEAEAELARDGLQGLFAEDTEEAHDDAMEKDTGTTDPTEPVSPSHGLKSIVDAIQLLLISARTRDLTKMHAHRTHLYCVRNVRAQLAATCVSSSAPTLSTWDACRRRSATSRHSLLV